MDDLRVRKGASAISMKGLLGPDPGLSSRSQWFDLVQSRDRGKGPLGSI